MPPEVIIREDMLSEGLQFTDPALQHMDGSQERVYVEYPPRPKYYGMAFEDGTEYKQVITTFSWQSRCLSCVLRSCQYWGEDNECRYCDINDWMKEQK